MAALYSDEKYSDAAEAFRHVTGLVPEYADAWYWLGVSYAAQGDRERTQAAYARLRQLDQGRAQDFLAKHGSLLGASPVPAASAPTSSSNQGDRITFDDGQYVWVPPGAFMMGCTPGDTECGSDESPRHRVTLNRGYYMARTDVTVAQYRRSGRPTPPAATLAGRGPSGCERHLERRRRVLQAIQGALAKRRGVGERRAGRAR